jgi:hypothetical protein
VAAKAEYACLRVLKARRAELDLAEMRSLLRTQWADRHPHETHLFAQLRPENMAFDKRASYRSSRPHRSNGNPPYQGMLKPSSLTASVSSSAHHGSVYYPDTHPPSGVGAKGVKPVRGGAGGAAGAGLAAGGKSNGSLGGLGKMQASQSSVRMNTFKDSVPIAVTGHNLSTNVPLHLYTLFAAAATMLAETECIEDPLAAARIRRQLFVPPRYKKLRDGYNTNYAILRGLFLEPLIMKAMITYDPRQMFRHPRLHKQLARRLGRKPGGKHEPFPSLDDMKRQCSFSLCIHEWVTGMNAEGRNYQQTMLGGSKMSGKGGKGVAALLTSQKAGTKTQQSMEKGISLLQGKLARFRRQSNIAAQHQEDIDMEEDKKIRHLEKMVTKRAVQEQQNTAGRRIGSLLFAGDPSTGRPL